jgi:RimJ/RimL family protein N-acetyltransferase
VTLTVPPTGSVGELTLRPWDGQDVQALIEVYQDPLLRQWTVPVTDAHEARQWLDREDRGWRTGERLSFKVEEGTHLVANVVLKLTRREHAHAEVGYWTTADGRGRGIAPRALDALSTWAFATFAGVTRLAALHDVRNPASCRVAEKAGYRFDRALPGPPPSTDRGHLHVRTG